MFSVRFVIDNEGIRYFRWPRGQTSIPWDTLDHYETLYKSRGGTTTYFRSNDGVTIGVPNACFDMQDIIKRISARRRFREKSYKRRHWYGG
jgi:hypothetical protein